MFLLPEGFGSGSIDRPELFIALVEGLNLVKFPGGATSAALLGLMGWENLGIRLLDATHTLLAAGCQGEVFLLEAVLVAVPTFGDS